MSVSLLLSFPTVFLKLVARQCLWVSISAFDFLTCDSDYSSSRGTTKSINFPDPNCICSHFSTGTSHTSVAAVGYFWNLGCTGCVCRIALAKYANVGLCPRIRTGESSAADNASIIELIPPWYRLDLNRTSYSPGMQRSIRLQVCRVLTEVEHSTIFGIWFRSANHLPIAVEALFPRSAKGRSWSFKYGKSQLDLACRVMINFTGSRY